MISAFWLQNPENSIKIARDSSILVKIGCLSSIRLTKWPKIREEYLDSF